MRVLDLTGQVFTNLTALEIVGKTKRNINLWKCQCSCGNIKITPTNYLTNGDTKSCGCYRAALGRRMDLVGEKYNKLTVVSYSHRTENNSMSFYNCICDCGETTTVAHGALRSGSTKSCGCLSNPKGESNTNYIHGKSRTKVHSVWCRIKDRCYNKNNQDYSEYGAKGIIVDELFIEDFLAFYEEVKDAPSPIHSLDRIDYTMGYIKGNMRWATSHQQARNKGKNSSNTSGITGVHIQYSKKFINQIYAISTWNDLDGRTRNKKFSVTKLGIMEAFKQACIYRANKLKELNLEGAGYSENHGLK
jgi:hypothetical protein